MTTRPVVLTVPAPAWLADVPEGLIRPPQGRVANRPEALVRWLSHRGVHVRPTLAQVEAERARRGMRRLGVAERPLILPMAPGVSPQRQATVTAARQAA